MSDLKKISRIYFNAITVGDLTAIEYIVRRNPRIIDLCNEHTNHNGLYYAIKNEKLEVVKYLISRYCRITINDLQKLIVKEGCSSQFIISILNMKCKDDFIKDVIAINALYESIFKWYLESYLRRKDFDNMLYLITESKLVSNPMELLEYRLNTNNSLFKDSILTTIKRNMVIKSILTDD